MAAAVARLPGPGPRRGPAAAGLVPECAAHQVSAPTTPRQPGPRMRPGPRPPSTIPARGLTTCGHAVVSGGRVLTQSFPCLFLRHAQTVCKHGHRIRIRFAAPGSVVVSPGFAVLHTRCHAWFPDTFWCLAAVS